MALTKSDPKLEQVAFRFDDQGQLSDVDLTVNFALVDDATGEVQTRIRKTASVWVSLTPSQQTDTDNVAQVLKGLAAGL